MDLIRIKVAGNLFLASFLMYINFFIGLVICIIKFYLSHSINSQVGALVFVYLLLDKAIRITAVGSIGCNAYFLLKFLP